MKDQKFDQSVDRVNETSDIQLKDCFRFRYAWRVEDFADSLIALSFSEEQSGGGGVSDDVAANGFLWIDRITHRSSWVRHDLVAHKDRNVELLTDLLHSVQELTEHLLSL